MIGRIRILAASACMGGLLISGPAPAQHPNDQKERIAESVKNSVAQARTIRIISSTSPTGLEFAEVSDAIQSQVGLPDDHGVVIVSVRPDSPGKKAGFQSNDILLSVDSQEIKDVAQARELLAKAKKEAKVKVMRAGKPEEILLQADLDDEAPRPALRKYTVTRPNAGSKSEFWIGVPVSPVDATLRSHLGSLPPEAGLIVNDVVPGSPAEKAGLKKNDVLVSIDGKPLTTVKSLVDQVVESEGKPVSLDYLRGGKSNSVKITPEKHYGYAERAIEIQGDRLMFRSPDHLFRFDAKASPDPNVLFLRDGKPLPGMAAKELEARTRFEAVPLKEAEASTKRLEAAIKDLTAKVEEIRKSVEQIRKADGKD